MISIRENIKEEARKLAICALYSSKGHFYAAEYWKRLHYWLGVPLTIVSAVGVYYSVEPIGHMLSCMVFVLSSLLTFLNTQKNRDSHFYSGELYDELYNQTRQFMRIECMDEFGQKDEELKIKLDRLYDRKYKLDKFSLQIPKHAYKKAKKGIKQGEGSFDDKLD